MPTPPLPHLKKKNQKQTNPFCPLNPHPPVTHGDCVAEENAPGLLPQGLWVPKVKAESIPLNTVSSSYRSKRAP